MTLKTVYTPKMLAKFTINHAKRNQLVLHVGISDTPAPTPTITWYSGVFNLHGGPYYFNGETTGTVPDGTFYIDFTDILTPGIAQKRYYLGVFDSKTGDSATLSSFVIKDMIAGGEYGVVNEPLPLTVDVGEAYVSIDYTFNGVIANYPPQAAISTTPDPASGPAPLTVHFDGTGSQDPDGTIVKYIWNFGDMGSPIWAGDDNVITNHTYEAEGIFCAKLTVTDNIGASSSKVVFITVGTAPGGKMHVSALDMVLNIISKGVNVNVNAIATVTIVDAGGISVSEATVSGHWSGATGDSDSGVTDSSGKVALQSDVLKNPSPPKTFTFTVDTVEKAGWTYDSIANVETSDSITYNGQAAPAIAAKDYPTQLKQAFPSMANPETWIPFTLSRSEHVIIRIYSATGQLVKTIDLGQRAPGAYVSKEKAAYWNGRNESGEKVSNGIYFYQMEAGHFRAMKKMVIVK